jgi:type I restriction enzyme S subunit
MIDRIVALTAGARMPRTEWSAMGTLLLPLPPPDEQAAIVRFLDWATRRIDRAIRAKRKLVALVTEQKQAVIHRAVTRGLDPHAPMKDSGIPWLGEIPAHWEVVRNLALFSSRTEAGAGNLPVLQVSLRSGVTRASATAAGRQQRFITDVAQYRRAYPLDIAYNTMRFWQGAVGVVPEVGLVSPAYIVLAPRTGTDSFFYASIFSTSTYQQQINRYSTGIVSDRNRMYWVTFKSMPNIYPPPDEQAAIVAHLDAATRDLDATIARTQRQIDLLREYRARLVADVVTGKLDVRAAAAALPDEALDDGEPLAPDDDDAADDDVDATDAPDEG